MDVDKDYTSEESCEEDNYSKADRRLRCRKTRGKDERHNCKECGKGFVTTTALKEHMLSHYKPFRCEYCEQSFARQYLLTGHLTLHTGDSPFWCTVCDKKFTRKHALKTHKLIHEGKKLHQCQICNKSFTQKGTLTVHMKIHSLHKLHKCDVCQKEYASLSGFREHILSHERPFRCDFCYRCFARQYMLDAHLRLHTGDSPFICKICNKHFVRKDGLVQHEKTHTQERLHKCYVCSKTFTQKGGLTTHMQLHLKDKRHKCTQCGKNFVSLSHLKIHQKGHNKSLPCEYCGRCFAHQFKLKEHIRMHTGETPYSCSICDQRFARRDYLKTHEKNHLNAKLMKGKLYECDTCSASFEKKSNLLLHRKDVHKVGPNQCHLCDRVFLLAHHYRTHLKSHERGTHYQLYKCVVCTRAFYQEEKLSEHVRQEHSGDVMMIAPRDEDLEDSISADKNCDVKPPVNMVLESEVKRKVKEEGQVREIVNPKMELIVTEPDNCPAVVSDSKDIVPSCNEVIKQELTDVNSEYFE